MKIIAKELIYTEQDIKFYWNLDSVQQYNHVSRQIIDLFKTKEFNLSKTNLKKMEYHISMILSLYFTIDKQNE